MNIEFRRDLQQLRFGDHLGLLYEDDTGKWDMVAAFFSEGIGRCCHCTYLFAAEVQEAKIASEFAARGMDLDELAGMGLVSLTSSADVYDYRSKASASAFTAWLDREIQAATSNGLTGLFVAGDADWLATLADSARQVREVESFLNEILPSRQTIAMCTYGRHDFDAAGLIAAVEGHPIICEPGRLIRNVYYIPPSEKSGVAPSDSRFQWMLMQLRNAHDASCAERIRARNQTAQANLGRFALGERTVDELLNELLQQTVQTMSADVAIAARLVPGEADRLADVHIWPDRAAWRGPIQIECGTHMEWAIQEPGALIVDDYLAAGAAHPPEAIRAAGLRCGIVTKLPGLAGAQGILGVFSRTPNTHGPWHKEYLEAAARVIGHAIERSHVQEALRLRERQLTTLLDNDPDIVLRVDRDLRCLYANPAAAAMTGWPLEDHVGISLGELGIPAAVWEEWEPVLRRMFDRRHPAKVTMTYPPGSDARYYSCRMVPELDTAGSVESLLVVAHDITELRLAAVELREQKLLVEAAIDNLPGLFFVFEESGKLVRWNRSWQLIAGYTTEEIERMHPLDFFLPDERDAVTAAILEAFETGSATVEADFVLRDGSSFPFLFTAQRAILWGRKCLIGTGIDITQRKEAQEALERRTFELAERVKESRCLYRISNVLHRAGADVDAAFEEVINLIPHGWQYPECTQVRLAVLDRVYQTPGYRDAPLKLESPIRLEDSDIGTLTVCYVDPPPTADLTFLPEEEQLLHSISERVADLMQRRRTEEALARSEAYFRSLIEHSTDIISLLDARGIILYESPSVERVLGYKPEELLGRAAVEVIHPDDRVGIAQAIADGVSRGEKYAHIEYRAFHKDGTERHLESIAVNQLDNPAVNGLVINSRDITDRKHLEDQLRQVQKMEAVGRLAGGIAHDFNNLLTVIEGYAEFLLGDLGTTDPRSADVIEIRKAARRAASLTRQLLAFSRKQLLRPVALDLNAVVSDMEKMLRRLIGEDIELETHLDPTTPSVRADPGQLEQVLLNLAVNAREAMPRGGRLIIRTESVELDEAYAEQHAEVVPGPYALLTVADTGVGMTREIQQQVFEPFFTTKDMGTGLGLSTVYGIVRQSDGHVFLYSEPGRGTSFKIILPAADQEPQAIREVPPHEGSLDGIETILLVEDEATVRNLAKRILEMHGYTVIPAADGHEALALSRAPGTTFDLLLTDVVMPQMNGRELAEQIRADRAGVRVLFASGYTEHAVMNADLIEPGMALIQKPFTAKGLLKRIRDVLDGR